MLPVVNPNHTLPITIRPARPDDRPALWRLAALDSAIVPAEPLLVAELDGELSVAVSASDLSAIADPFVPTAHIVEMVRDHVRRSIDEPQPRRRLRSRLAPALSLRAA
jgi:hypothetical protein